MLWLCLHLPHLPLDVFTRAAAAPEPRLVTQGHGRGQRVLYCNRAATRQGIQPGMRVSSAQALVNGGEKCGLEVYARDETAEQSALDRLAAWAGQFTSMVNQVPPASLVLEIGASLALLGGLDALHARIQNGVRELGYATALSVAPTPLGATWLAHAGQEKCITDHAGLRRALAALPLHDLELAEKQCTLLQDMGLRTLGDCLRLPRDGLARRLGPEFVTALDRALGTLPDPRPAYVAPPHYAGHLLLPAPVEDIEGLTFPLHRLLHEFAGFLLSRGAGVQSAQLTLHHLTHTPTQVKIDLLTPTRDARHLMRLVRDRLERVVLPEAVEELALRSVALQTLASRNHDFFVNLSLSETRAALVERLQARLGREAVHSLGLVPDHRPEHAWRYVAPGKGKSETMERERPLWILPEPVVLAVRDGRPYFNGGLILERDRERIESGWWDGQDVRRDYFIARNTHGVRLWVFRELDGEHRWRLHGIFG